ncbi:putative tRNA threonylcarbamoyladenosine biosynthesis protein kae1, partial [Ascosphaera pollenicola]
MLDSGERPAAGEFSPSSRFVQWLRECPGVRVSQKVEITQSETSESGAFAAENVAEDEELFMIPADVCLTFKSSHLKSCPGLTRLEEELGPWLCLMLTMVYEFLRGTASPWQPYLSTLPSSFDSLMFWSEEELKELQGSAIKDRIGKQDADTAILTRLLPIALQHPEVFPHPNHSPSFNPPEGRDYFLAVAHRMGSLIMAYAFDVESGDENDEGEDGYVTDDEDRPTSKAMVPLTDLLNAAVETHNTRLYQEEGAFIVRATKAIAAGEELISEHEGLPRSECLRRYGTVPHDCTQFDVVDMPRDIICQEYGIATNDDPR